MPSTALVMNTTGRFTSSGRHGWAARARHNANSSNTRPLLPGRLNVMRSRGGAGGRGHVFDEFACPCPAMPVAASDTTVGVHRKGGNGHFLDQSAREVALHGQARAVGSMFELRCA